MFREPSTAVSAALAVDTAHERAVDRVVAWLGLYLPSYGTSVVLHAAVVLLAAFMMVFPETSPQAEKIFAGYQEMPDPRPVERRPEPPDRSPRGKREGQESGFVHEPLDNRVPGIALNKDTEFIPVIGLEGDREIGGPPEGLGDGTGGPIWIFRPLRPDDGPRRIVYVVDRSGSMTDSLYIVKMELKRVIAELAEASEFHVVFYSSGPPVEMPTRRLVHATERNKRLAMAFIDEVVAAGETDPSRALERAFAVRPDLVYLLTDGEFDRGITGLVRRENTGRRTQVHTIGFLYETATSKLVLETIAKQNGGSYKFVSETDVAALGGV